MNIGSAIKEEIKSFVLKDIDETIVMAHSDPFWKSLRDKGTEIWLDTGDIEDAGSLWSEEMTALTTNNTLLNKEIQKGMYDDYIAQAKRIVKDLSPKQQITEIAFMLNARHGFRLVRRFGSLVSVELHTDLAHDFAATVNYALRLFEICPDHFLIKVPFTATGLLAARYLGERGVKINLTLEFSARQNAFAALVARPAYVNVFLGRIGAYFKNNDLGSEFGIGERTTLATQKLVNKLSSESGYQTRLIAASIRTAEQVENLTGVDTLTIPVRIAAESCKKKLPGSYSFVSDRDFPVVFGRQAEGCHFEKLWEVTENELLLANEFSRDPPKSGIELINLAHQSGCGDLFPILAEEDLNQIARDGKIPVHSHWEKRIRSGELALDALLNLAGLASFAADQTSLDNRIAGILLK
ncbi:MAG: transaldolase family protein [Bacteroidales bacterium]|nr:transaldolase family protein [Bacteroidales bacterium]